MFGVYRNPDLSDNILNCFLTAMGKVQSVDRKVSFFMGDVNVHHEERLASSTITVHGRAALNFASSAGCGQMVTEPTHFDGGVLDLLLTDIYDLVEIRVDSSVGTSDHSTIIMDVVLEQPIPHLVCRQVVYLKNSVVWELVRGDVRSLNWNKIIRPNYPVSILHKAMLHVICDKVRKRKIVIRTGKEPWFDDQCVLAYCAEQRAYRV